MAGDVFINDEVHDKPGKRVSVDADVRLREAPAYVSRGGTKLAAVFERYSLDITGKIAVDVGASTGGFTDCLLQYGAAKVYAIDVGYGQLAWKLRSDPRVVVLERTNIRYLDQLPGEATSKAEFAVIDVSFIGLSLVLPAVVPLLEPESLIVALIKPQFEAGRDNVGKGGVVRSEKVHRRVLLEILALADRMKLVATSLMPSPILGPAGNAEFFVILADPISDCFGSSKAIGYAEVDQALREATALRKGG